MRKYRGLHNEIIPTNTHRKYFHIHNSTCSADISRFLQFFSLHPVFLHLQDPMAWARASAGSSRTGKRARRSWAQQSVSRAAAGDHRRRLSAAHGQGNRRIEVGKRADCAVLGEDPLAVEPAHLKDVPVLGTVLGGQPVAI